jgi:hypothetical protein
VAALALAALNPVGARTWGDPPAGGERGGGETASPGALGSVGVPSDVNDRLRRLEAIGTAVLEQNRRLADENQKLARRLESVIHRNDELENRLNQLTNASATPTPPEMPTPLPDAPFRADASSVGDVRPPVPAPNGDVRPLAPAPNIATWDVPESNSERLGSRFLIGGYDDEKSQFILVQPNDPDRTPFALNFDLITQLRFTGFARSVPSWTDSAGANLPVRNYDTFQVNRNWFQFSGYALDPRLQFMAIIFSSSTSNNTLFLGWLDYRFSKAFTLSAGYYKVPGSREWSDSFRYTLGADRTMATTFFRPGMSPGIWASGEPLRDLHYIAMVANSVNGLDLAGNRIGSNMAFGGSLWWEPCGKFGPGPSDIEWHERPTPRIGTSLTFSREQLPGPNAVQANPENTLFRLSDGTPLSTPGALAPGVQILTTGVQLWSIDAAVKYRGLSLSGEYYLRWLDDFRYTGGPLSIRSLFDSGAYGQASYFVIPKRLEGYARSSFVNGRFGGGNEWSGGLNWYLRSTRNWRLTFDVTRINHSPAQNILTGYRAGESGTLFQLQMLTDF